MPRGVRRSTEDRIADLERKIAALKAKAAKPVNIAKTEEMKAVISRIKQLSKEQKWPIDEIVKVINAKIGPKSKPAPTANAPRKGTRGRPPKTAVKSLNSL